MDMHVLGDYISENNMKIVKMRKKRHEHVEERYAITQGM
jgi:archaellum biogenesis protein FlaJ (TadC family)